MLVTKCDKCKKEIKNHNKEAVVAGLGWPTFSFCRSCGKAIVAFLKKNKFLPKDDD